MKPFRIVIAAATLALAGAAFAQAPTGRPGSTPDGSRPADGAIQGGSIVPGESGGMPNAAQRSQRCNELSGTLRDDCLLKERNSGTGASRAPDSKTAPPPDAPPPQNPR